ncbi:uncharacterized protein A4U43_C04F26550 [Asparagus officinalis]|uniref:Uncharacterized protein n=1 Tax=Asparagus officinalis TaxID=4686 RepID=A0A5P1F5L1_ASPOF|nr:uncharacterized protein A4U43_C04F26550 [Asparagus officinalis]
MDNSVSQTLPILREQSGMQAKSREDGLQAKAWQDKLPLIDLYCQGKCCSLAMGVGVSGCMTLPNRLGS